ncbi:putative RNA polymerase II subunit B1 CTD phosphatase RPAP2 [Nymphon striatum]|nr:putative RNA polymerase II subunit B1 CTD phosphatase RPAP2 [Nymphon striatum]
MEYLLSCCLIFNLFFILLYLCVHQSIFLLYFYRSKVLASVEMQRKFMLEAQTVILKCTDSTITEEELIKLGSSINASYYDDVAVERSLQKMCGYPICSSTLKQMPKQKYHISTKANKVYDITERKDFCSNQCYKRSKYFKDQLPTCPVWLIDKSEYSSFSLLKDESTSQQGMQMRILCSPAAKGLTFSSRQFVINDWGLPGQEYGMDFPSNECNSGFKTPKSNVSVCEDDNLNDDLEDYEREISLDNEEILENELEQLPKEADSLKSLNEKGNEISESLEKLLDFCDAEAIDITTPSDDRGKNNITNHTKIKQSFGQNKSSPEKKWIHQKLVDAVPEARTAPTRKIQLIDFQPMPKVLAKGLNIDYSKSVKFSDKKYETETFKTVSDENIHINDEISNKALNPPMKNKHFETVQTILSQWMTSNSCKFLIGEKMFEEHLAAGKTVLKTKQLDLSSLELSYINMLQRLDLEEKEEEELDTTLIGKSVPDNSQESQTLPDIDKFKEDTERMTMNMRSFFLGKPEYVISNLEADNENTKPPNQSQNTGKGKDFKKSSSRKKSKNTVKSKDVKSISEKSDESITNKKLLLNVYVRSLRHASFSMYLDALTELACWFHDMDHMNYARWIPVHLKHMDELPERHPEVARKFREGSFTVQKTKMIFSSIAIDQAHGQNNACIKGDGGAVGLTNNPAALRRWMIAGLKVARVIEEFQHGNQHFGREDIRHHDQTTSVQASFTIDVRSLVKVMEELGNPFEEDSPDLVTLDTKEIVGSPAMEAVRKVREIGLKQFQAFSRDCLVERTKPVADTIHRNKLSVQGSTNKERTKIYLLTCFEDIAYSRSEAPTTTTSIVIDGAAIVQMLKPAVCKNFREHAQKIVIPHMSTRFQSSSRLDLVWDTYRADSLKASARAKRGKGVHRCVVAQGAIPRNWQNFLRVDTNKTQLLNFLSEALLLWFNLKDMQLVVTDEEEVCLKPPLSSLAPCTQEEADSRMLLYVSHSARHGHNKIMIRTVDTDVVVLAVSVVQHLQPEKELWIAFGTGKEF